MRGHRTILAAAISFPASISCYAQSALTYYAPASVVTLELEVATTHRSEWAGAADCAPDRPLPLRHYEPVKRILSGSLTVTTEADRQCPLSLQLDQGRMSTGEVRVGTTSDGRLASVNATSAGTGGAAVLGFTRFLGSALALASGVPGATALAGADGPTGRPQSKLLQCARAVDSAVYDFASEIDDTYVELERITSTRASVMPGDPAWNTLNAAHEQARRKVQNLQEQLSARLSAFAVQHKIGTTVTTESKTFRLPIETLHVLPNTDALEVDRPQNLVGDNRRLLNELGVVVTLRHDAGGSAVAASPPAAGAPPTCAAIAAPEGYREKRDLLIRHRVPTPVAIDVVLFTDEPSFPNGSRGVGDDPTTQPARRPLTSLRTNAALPASPAFPLVFSRGAFKTGGMSLTFDGSGFLTAVDRDVEASSIASVASTLADAPAAALTAGTTTINQYSGYLDARRQAALGSVDDEISGLEKTLRVRELQLQVENQVDTASLQADVLTLQRELALLNAKKQNVETSLALASAEGTSAARLAQAIDVSALAELNAESSLAIRQAQTAAATEIETINQQLAILTAQAQLAQSQGSQNTAELNRQIELLQLQIRLQQLRESVTSP
jgi:hypothetical protein